MTSWNNREEGEEKGAAFVVIFQRSGRLCHMSILQMSVSGAILILIIALIRMVTLHILPKYTFVILWMIALARLLIPFPPLFHIPLLDFLPMQFTEMAQVTPASSVLEREIPSSSALESQVSVSASIQNTTDAKEIQQPTIETAGDNKTASNTKSMNDDIKSSMSTQTILMIIWAVGAFTVGVFFIVLYAAGYRKFHSAVPIKNDRADEWLKAHPIKRKLSIKSLEGFDSPMTYGLLHPVILVPSAADWWNSEGINYALEHEYVHIRRFDAWMKIALALVLTCHWFNPAVWLLFILANYDIELSCDEAVLRRFNTDVRGVYARTLLAVEEHRYSTFYTSFGMNTTQERIMEIMKYKKKTFNNIALAALLVAVLTLCAGASATNRNAANPSKDREAPDGVNIHSEEARTILYSQDGVEISVPVEYKDLIYVDNIGSDNLFNICANLYYVSEYQESEEYVPSLNGGWMVTLGTFSPNMAVHAMYSESHQNKNDEDFIGMNPYMYAVYDAESNSYRYSQYSRVSTEDGIRITLGAPKIKGYESPTMLTQDEQSVFFENWAQEGSYNCSEENMGKFRAVLDSIRIQYDVEDGKLKPVTNILSGEGWSLNWDEVPPTGHFSALEAAASGVSEYGCVLTISRNIETDTPPWELCKGAIDYIMIEDGVTILPDSAFSNCANLISINIGNSLQEISADMFANCNRFGFSDMVYTTDIIMSDSVTKINGGAFRNCRALRRITIPKSVKEIAPDAFEGCNDYLTIIGTSGSYAERFAHENNLTFLSI